MSTFFKTKDLNGNKSEESNSKKSIGSLADTQMAGLQNLAQLKVELADPA